MPEPSIARLASDGESVTVVGTTEVYRLRLDREAGRIEIDERWRPSYGPEPDRAYGWDPVITDRHVFWMDNGRNATDRTMLGTGDAPSPVRLWWARLDDGETRSAEITGLPHGTVSNPPAWDPEGRIVVAFDSGNPGIRAWRVEGDELDPLWRRDEICHAGHIVVYPDTREIVVNDWTDLPFLRAPVIRPLLRATAGIAARSRARDACLGAQLPRPPGRPRPRHGSREGAGRHPLADPELHLPGAGIRPRRLLPVVHHGRQGRRRLGDNDLHKTAKGIPPSRRSKRWLGRAPKGLTMRRLLGCSDLGRDLLRDEHR